jgi:septum site-determining protein MinC
VARVDIKGLNKGLVFVFSGGNGEEYQAIIKNKIDSNPKIFNGSPVVFQGEGLKTLSYQEIAALQRLCLDYGMILNNMSLPSKAEKSSGKDLIIYKRLRSGQKVHSEGTIIIWGDVHESAEITAARDVVVMGKLEGIAHAGCYGDNASTVFALNLCPRQLRIGDRISRSSGEQQKSPYPEIAYVEGDNICIKEYKF